MFSFLAHSSEKVCRFDGYSLEKAYLCHNIRYELVSFIRAISGDISKVNISEEISQKISQIMNEYANFEDDNM